MSTQDRAQFTPGPCTCEIVMRTGETLDSSLGDRLCSDISRIQLCPKHSAAPAMYEVLQATLAYFLRSKQSHAPEVRAIRTALAQAEGNPHNSDEEMEDENDKITG